MSAGGAESSSMVAVQLCSACCMHAQQEAHRACMHSGGNVPTGVTASLLMAREQAAPTQAPRRRKLAVKHTMLRRAKNARPVAHLSG